MQMNMWLKERKVVRTKWAVEGGQQGTAWVSVPRSVLLSALINNLEKSTSA